MYSLVNGWVIGGVTGISSEERPQPEKDMLNSSTIIREQL